MLDLETIAIEAAKNALNSDALKERVEERISKTIESEILDQFRERSDFSKSIKQIIVEKMCIDLDNLDFTAYNQWLTVTIKERVKARQEAVTFNQIDTLLNEIMPIANPVVSLDELIEDLRKSKPEYDQDHCGSFAVGFHRDSGYLAKHITIGFDEDNEKGYSFSNSRTPTKTVKDCSWSIKVDISSHKVIGFDAGYRGNTNRAKVTVFRSDFQSKLFQMYAAGTVIDLGDYLEAFNNMEEDSERDACDLDIDNSYQWFED